MKQTAVEWLEEQMRLRRDEGLSLSFYDLEMFAKKAKQMEKEQIIKVFIDVCEVLLKGVDTEHQGKLKQAAEQYYNETYGK